MSEDPDLAYGEVNQRMAEAVVAMENQSNEDLRELGPLFNETDNQLQGRRTEPSKGRPGNKPTRTFVWLPHENAEDFSSLPSSKVKFPKELKGENLLALLKREKREIPQNCRSLNFFKSQSAGNHALFKVGSDLSGREVVENFKSTSTRVYLAERLPRVNVPVTFVPEEQINNTQAIIVPTNTGQQSQEAVCIKGEIRHSVQSVKIFIRDSKMKGKLKIVLRHTQAHLLTEGRCSLPEQSRASLVIRGLLHHGCHAFVLWCESLGTFLDQLFLWTLARFLSTMKLIPVAAFIFLLLLVTVPDESEANPWFVRIALALGVKLAKNSYYARCNTRNVPSRISCPSVVFGVGLNRRQAQASARFYARTVGDDECAGYVGHCQIRKFIK
ncbi:hypothetical protein ACROYT_G009041 [Oculina patagonica]